MYTSRRCAAVAAVMFAMAATAPGWCGENSPNLRAKSASLPETHHPHNWRFTMPKGDMAKGRRAFEKFECFYCHRVNGESFPEPTENGPELSQMGPLHPVEFFAESIINPSAVADKKDRDAAGRSYMSEEHLSTMTLEELIHLSSYIASLRPPVTVKTVSGVGKIVAIVARNRELIIDHEEIKGFMDAMTMGYRVRHASLLKNVRAGDRIRFTIDASQREITTIEKLKARKD